MSKEARPDGRGFNAVLRRESSLTLPRQRVATPSPPVNRVFIKTYGCQMNERDSEAVAAMLRARGYRIVADENDCDILLLNTCSVRDAAEQKAIGKAGFISAQKRRNPD